MGVFTHGSNFLPLYVNWIQVGSIDPTATPELDHEFGAMALLNAHNCMGQVAGTRAMELAITKAKQYGVGVVGVKESNHFGAAAYYTMQAMRQDAIGFCTTNGIPLLAPWGGLTPTFSNTPISYALPAGKERPVVLDMAVTVVAAGKVALAKRKGEQIPLGWALNAEGEPTADPNLAALMAPIGGPKGYGLALVMDALSGVLTGALFARHVRRGGTPNTPQGMGQFFMAIDIAAFLPVAEFKARMDEQIQQVKSSRRAKGVERIYLPGEIELENMERAQREGIPFPAAVVEDLDAMAGKLGIQPLSVR